SVRTCRGTWGGLIRSTGCGTFLRLRPGSCNWRRKSADRWACTTFMWSARWDRRAGKRVVPVANRWLWSAVSGQRRRYTWSMVRARGAELGFPGCGSKSMSAKVFVPHLPDLIHPSDYSTDPDGREVRLRVRITADGVEVLGDSMRPGVLEA